MSWKKLQELLLQEKDVDADRYWELALDLGLPAALWWTTGEPKKIGCLWTVPNHSRLFAVRCYRDKH